MRSHVARLLRFFLDGLIGLGQGWVYIPAPPLDEPAAGHPERLCPDQPLTETERGLARQLADEGEMKR
ncbi:DUF6059 family protein [Streptomyces sp. NPDC004647]|uniref:DUF6059 family protein n=1 Tax=Streptomyces sp. NPDC004647 TaxID=3154671 RepID=UPI0033B4C5C8